MTLLPIIERELLVRARSRASRRLRLGAALVGTWVCVPWLLSGASLTPVNGGDLFRALAGACFILCCAGCLFTCDTVGSERREGTLGLLLLTRVRAVDVLLGKLGSNGLDALSGLVALLPLLMIPVLMGGTTGWEAGRKGLALLDTLCLALAAGLYESVSHPKQFRAAVGAVLLVLAIVLLPAISWERTALPHCWPLFSPLSAMIWAGDVAYRSSPLEVLGLFGPRAGGGLGLGGVRQ